jgi:hypothetical protein
MLAYRLSPVRGNASLSEESIFKVHEKVRVPSWDEFRWPPLNQIAGSQPQGIVELGRGIF